MEDLQLTLKTPIEELVPAMIEFNADELVAKVTAATERYATAVYSEDTIKDAKADKAALLKLSKALNAERISLGKIYLAPYEKFKGEIDRIISVVNAAASNIGGQLDAFEEARVGKRRELLRQHFIATASDISENIDYERIEDTKWLNASTSDKKAKELVDAVVAGIRTDIATLHQLQSEDIDELLLFYFKNLSLAATLQENEARKERARKIAEMRARREEEARLLAEERKRAQEANLTAQNAFENVETQQLPPEFTPPEETPKVPTLCCVRFEITGTREQLQALKQFIIANHLTIKKI
ncbi:MAG: DUF1351 domain-containing protein [Oscillospiraceae bacterium]